MPALPLTGTRYSILTASIQDAVANTGIDYFADKNTTIGFTVNGTVDKEWFTSGSHLYDRVSTMRYNTISRSP